MVKAFHKGDVEGFLHTPEQAGGRGLVITHGAGGNCGMALLVAVAAAFTDEGYTVLRCDLPFRRKRPHGPPSPSGAAADRAGLRDAVGVMRGLVNGRVVLGGQSYGGRQATMLAAEEAGLVDALLLLSYPLHPPGKPEQLRTAHFPALRTDAVFLQGAKDPFGSIEEMREAVKLIPARTQLIEIERVGHDLGRGAGQEELFRQTARKLATPAV